MKKLVLMLAVVFSMSFFACGNKEQAAEATEAAADSAAVVEAVVEEACTACDSCTCDSCACDTVVVAAEEAVVAE